MKGNKKTDVYQSSDAAGTWIIIISQEGRLALGPWAPHTAQSEAIKSAIAPLPESEARLALGPWAPHTAQSEAIKSAIAPLPESEAR